MYPSGIGPHYAVSERTSVGRGQISTSQSRLAAVFGGTAGHIFRLYATGRGIDLVVQATVFKIQCLIVV
jgi:hypothetical protein